MGSPESLPFTLPPLACLVLWEGRDLGFWMRYQWHPPPDPGHECGGFGGKVKTEGIKRKLYLILSEPPRTMQWIKPYTGKTILTRTWGHIFPPGGFRGGSWQSWTGKFVRKNALRVSIFISAGFEFGLIMSYLTINVFLFDEEHEALANWLH